MKYIGTDEEQDQPDQPRPEQEVGQEPAAEDVMTRSRS